MQERSGCRGGVVDGRSGRAWVLTAVLLVALIACPPASAGTSTVPPSTSPVLPPVTGVVSTAVPVSPSDSGVVVEPVSTADDDLPGSSPPAVLTWGLALSLLAAVAAGVFLVRAQRRAARDPGR